MDATKRGRALMGHTYHCDCQSCQDCEPSWVTIEFEGDPDDCAFLDSSHCPTPPPVVQVNGFTLGVLLSCIFWGAVLVILCAVWEAVS